MTSAADAPAPLVTVQPAARPATPSQRGTGQDSVIDQVPQPRRAAQL